MVTRRLRSWLDFGEGLVKGVGFTVGELSETWIGFEGGNGRRDRLLGFFDGCGVHSDNLGNQGIRRQCPSGGGQSDFPDGSVLPHFEPDEVTFRSGYRWRTQRILQVADAFRQSVDVAHDVSPLDVALTPSIRLRRKDHV